MVCIVNIYIYRHLCRWVPCASQENRRVAARSPPTPLAGGVGRESCPGDLPSPGRCGGSTTPCGAPSILCVRYTR